MSTKLNVYYLTTKPVKQDFSIDIGDTTIPSTENAKFLGLWLDNKLSCRKHTNTLMIKIK